MKLYHTGSFLGAVQARITARIAARNKELEQEIIRLKWQLNATQTELSHIKEWAGKGLLFFISEVDNNNY